MNSIAGIILAAGESSRMGEPKALLEYGGKTFLERCTDSLHTARITDIVVVTGSDRDQIESRFTHLRPALIFLTNPNPEKGQYSSLQTGVASLSRDTGAAVVHLVDHPAVRSDTVISLIRTFEETSAAIVIPSYRQRRGHPVLYSSRLFKEILESPPESDARALLRRHETDIRYAVVDDPGVRVDVDTPDDFNVLRANGDADTR